MGGALRGDVSANITNIKKLAYMIFNLKLKRKKIVPISSPCFVQGHYNCHHAKEIVKKYLLVPFLWRITVRCFMWKIH